MVNKMRTKILLYFFVFLVIFSLNSPVLLSQNKEETDNPNNLPPNVLSEINQYKTALIANPNDAVARNMLGFVYQENKMYMEALVEYSLAVKLYPKSPLYRNNLGDLYMQLGNAEAACKELEVAAKLAPLEPTILVNYAKALIEMDKFNLASTCLKRARAIEPDYIETDVVMEKLKIASEEFKIRKQREIAERDEMLKKLEEAEQRRREEQELERKKKEEEDRKFGNLLIFSIIGVSALLLVLTMFFYLWNLPAKKIQRAHKKGDLDNIIYHFENSPKPITDIKIIEMYYSAIKETTFWKKRLDILKTLIKHNPSEIQYYYELFESHFMAKSSVKVITSDIAKFEKTFSSGDVRKEMYKHLLTLSTKISGYLKILSDTSTKYFKLEKKDFSLYKNIFDYNISRNDFKEAENILISLSQIPEAGNVMIELEKEMISRDDIASIGILSGLLYACNTGTLKEIDLLSYKSAVLRAIKNYNEKDFPYSIRECVLDYIRYLKKNDLPADAESLFDALDSVSLVNVEEIIEMGDVAFSINKKDIGIRLFERLFILRPDMSGFIIEKLKEISESEEPNVMVHFLLARCFYTIGNLNQAIFETELAYNYNIKDKSILKFFIQILIKANLKDKLLSTLEDLSQIEEDNYYKVIYSEILILSKYYEKAAEILENFIGIPYYDSFFYQKLLKTAASNQDWKLIERAVGKFGKKDRMFTSLTIRFLEKIQAPENEAIISPLLQKFYSYEKESGKNQEMLALENQIDNNLQNPSFINNLVKMYLHEGLLEKANAVIVKVISGTMITSELVAHFFNVNLILGNTTSILMFIKNSKSKLNNMEDIVIQALKSVVEINPFLFEAYGMLCQLYLKRNMLTECTDLLEKLVLLNPRDNNSVMLLRKMQIETLQNPEKKQ